MDDTRRQVLTEELEEAIKERDRLTAFIELLGERLGVPIAGPNGPAPSGTQEPAAAGDPASAVAEGEFYGMSAPKASKALLQKFGRSRPMKTDEIFEAVTKGGVKIKESGTLYRSLFRDEAFHRVGRGVWGLSEWYPNARRDATDDAEQETSAAQGTREAEGQENGNGQPSSPAVPSQEAT
jgi:hypothetical protein